MIAFAAAAAVLFSACSAGSSKKNAAVRINIASEPDSLDPWQSAAADTSSIFRNVFDGLMLYSPSGTPVPGLAEKYEVSADSLTYTFHLVKNATFHNGKKFTSADAVYTYNNLAGLNGCKSVNGKFKRVKSVSAPDEYTFVVQLSEPDASFLALAVNPILPEGYSEQAQKPVGAGPFKFVEYVPGQKVVFERYDGYYKKDRMPKISRAEVYIMSNEASVISALQSDQLDAAYFISGTDADALKQSFTVSSSPQNMIQIFGLNNAVKPFNDERVRQAMNYAVNKKNIIDGVWNGYAAELYSNYSPVMKDTYNDSLSGYYTYDTEKAKQLLKEAGYPDGFSMTITVPSNYEPHVNAAQILVSDLAKVGIKATIESVEWATWLDKVYTKADYQSTVIAFGGKVDPSEILGRYVSSYSHDFIRFNDAQFDSLMGAAAVETDTAKRADLYKQCQKIMTEKSASVFLCDPELIVATKKNLKGYTFYPVSYIDFSTLYYE